MNTITKTIAGIFGMMMLLTVQNVNAQWTTVKAHVQGSDICKVSGISFDSYKGMESGTFEIIVSVTEVRDKGKVNFQLRTQSINLVSYDSYSYHPYPEVQYCSGTDGKLQERRYTNSFLANDIGTEAFEQAKKSAIATFDVEISFIVKDEKYGISGFGSQKGWGYRANRIFKNVSANSVFWADNPIETTYPIEDIKIVMHPKLVSFTANESAIQTSVENFIAEKNKQAEKECKEKVQANDADKQKKDEENKKAEAKAKEIDEMKKKLGGTTNITSNKAKTDDFWSGGTDKSTASAAKDTDDFWAGGSGKSVASKSNDDFWSGGRDKTTSNNGGSSLEAVNKDGRIYLKDAYDIIKEWDVNKYSAISRLEGSNDFFKLFLRTQGYGFLSRNNFVIVDKQGKTIKIDDDEIFGHITSREGGGYTIMKYLSESYYEGKEERFPKVKDWYTSSSEAISDVEKGIERVRKEILEERKRNRPGTVYLVSSYTFHVVQVKEIITNDKMQSLISKTGYKVR